MYGYIAILPWFIGFLVFTAGPMVYSAYLTFTDWELLTPPEWVGFKNFERLGRDPLFRTAMFNTFIYTIFSVPLQLLVALGVALLLNLNIRGKNVYRAVAFLPSQMPAVATPTPPSACSAFPRKNGSGISNWSNPPSSPLPSGPSAEP
jgi:multiple sugar transport system permease protein